MSLASVVGFSWTISRRKSLTARNVWLYTTILYVIAASINGVVSLVLLHTGDYAKEYCSATYP